MSNFLSDRQTVPLYLKAAPETPEPTELTPEEQVQERRDAFSAAFTLTNTIRGLGGAIHEAGFQTDYNYRLDLESELKDVPESYHPLLSSILTDSRSAEHASWLKDRTLTELKAFEDLGKHTGGSMLGNFAVMGLSTLADPTTWAAMGAGGFLSHTDKAARMGRLKNAARVAGFEASLNAALEAPLVAGNPTSTVDDIWWAMGFGAVLGLGVGGIAYRAPKNSLAGAESDAVAGVVNQGMEDMARTEAHIMAGRESELDIRPPEELYDMDTTVRREPAPKVDDPYDPVETLAAQKAQLETLRKELDERELPDAPVQFKMPDVEGMMEELDFIRKVRSGEIKLEGVDRTNADMEFQKAKREFLEAYRQVDPRGHNQLFGESINPSMKDFEDNFKAVQGNLEALRRKSAKEEVKYKEALARYGEEKDTILDQLDAVETQLRAAREARPADDARSVGAAQANEQGQVDLSNISEEEFDAIYDMPETRQQTIPGTKKKTRWDMAGVIARSPNQFIRWAGNLLFQDATPKVGHAVNPQSATELAEWIVDTTMGGYDAVAKPMYKKWLEEQGLRSGILARALDWDGKMRSAFEEEVATAVKTGTHQSPSVMQAAEAMQQAYERAFNFAVDSKLPGFDQIPYDPHYLPRKTSHQKVNRLNTDFVFDRSKYDGRTPLAEMYYRAMMEANPWFDKAVTSRIAKQIAKRELQRANKVSYDAPDFGQMTREKLDELFDDIGVTDVDRKNFFAKLDQQFAQPDAGRISHAKNRMNLNTEHTPIQARYTGPSIPGGWQTGDMVGLRLEDMMETRGDILLQGYVNDIGGWGSLNRVTNGRVHNPSSLKKWFEDMVDYEQTFVGDPKRNQRRSFRGTSALEGELKYLQAGVNRVLGRPLSDTDSGIAMARRFLNGWNFMRLMNQTIFPQFSEISKVATSTSIETVNHYVPIMRKTFADIRAGRPLTDSQRMLVLAAREMGLGTNYFRGGVISRHNTDIDGSLFTKQDKWASRIAHLKKVTAQPLQAMMDVQEVLAATGLQAEMAMRAKGLKQITDADYKRLAWMGLSKSDVNNINAQIMKYATDEQGRPYASSPDKWIGSLNLDKWDDYAARDKFSFGIKRRVGEVIQTNNIGNLPWIATDNFGAMLLQFRTFQLAAYQKQLMHHLSYNDLNAYMTFAVNSAMSALVYATQVQLKSIGREDAQEYRDRALTAKNLAFAAWERSAWSSMTPMAGDVVSMAAFNRVVNPYNMRSSELGKLSAGIPAVDLMDKTVKAFNSLSGAIHGDDSWRKAAKDALAISLYSNALGVYHIGNLLGHSVPKTQ